MKKIVILIIILALLSGCTPKSLTSLSINYEVQSLSEYNKQIEQSTLTRNLSDFRMLEFNIVGTPYCNMYDYVVLQGMASIQYEKTVNAITTDFIEIDETNLTEIHQNILVGKSIKLKTSGLFIPVLPELKEQASIVEFKDVFIKSILKELGA